MTAADQSTTEGRHVLARALANLDGEGWVFDPPILDGVTRESHEPEFWLRRADVLLTALENASLLARADQPTTEPSVCGAPNPGDGAGGPCLASSGHGGIHFNAVRGWPLAPAPQPAADTETLARQMLLAAADRAGEIITAWGLTTTHDGPDTTQVPGPFSIHEGHS